MPEDNKPFIPMTEPGDEYKVAERVEDEVMRVRDRYSDPGDTYSVAFGIVRTGLMLLRAPDLPGSDDRTRELRELLCKQVMRDMP